MESVSFLLSDAVFPAPTPLPVSPLLPTSFPLRSCSLFSLEPGTEAL